MVYNVEDGFLGPLNANPAEVEYENLWDERHIERGFSDIEVVAFDRHREWDFQSIVAYVHLLSFVGFENIGDVQVVAAVREALSNIDSELFT